MEGGNPRGPSSRRLHPQHLWSAQLTRESDKTFQFITVSSDRLSKKDRRLVRSHISRNNAKRLGRSHVKSWILQRDGSLVDPGKLYYSIPGHVGSYMTSILPEPLDQYLRGDTARFLVNMRDALYPPEICLQVDSWQSTWTSHLLIDHIYASCAVFSVESYLDLMRGESQSPLTQFHLFKTLRLLQQRLDDADGGFDAISDPTIMVVTNLGLTAELVGDSLAAEKHMAGLARMVALRGGLEFLRHENSRLPAKVCRVDLCLALRFGTRPVFLNDNLISWDPYVSKCSPKMAIQTSSHEHPKISNFVQTLDHRLIGVWEDMHDFSQLSNLACQTANKLTPNAFSEMMSSILYRLLGLTFSESAVDEAIRLGLATFASSVYFQWRGLRDRQEHANQAFQTALGRLRQVKTIMPLQLQLWLLMVSRMCTPGGCNAADLHQWTTESLGRLHLRSWKSTREVLKQVMWIDFIHDASAKAAFEELTSTPT